MLCHRQCTDEYVERPDKKIDTPTSTKLVHQSKTLETCYSSTHYRLHALPDAQPTVWKH